MPSNLNLNHVYQPEGPGSVTCWLDQLRQFGRNEDLQREIWDRYFRKLAAVARKHLSLTARRTVDDEDIALSALNSFFDKLSQGRYPQLKDRAQLWTLLTTIATYKSVNARVAQQAMKRGGGAVRGDSVFRDASLAKDIVATEPGPRELAEFRDLTACLLRQLPPINRTIAYEKLLGKSDAEIAEKLSVSPRTISRKLTQIRSAWSKHLEAIIH